MKKERLDKILAHHGFGTRKDVKKLVRSGLVEINGCVCRSADEHICPETDCIAVEGKTVVIRQHVYLMMNKNAGVVCSTKDGVHRTVIEIVPEEYRNSFLGGDLHPIGRLDIDTEGLLVLTTDGVLTHTVTSPKNHVPKTYFVRLARPVPLAERFAYSEKCGAGFEIPPEGNEDGFTCMPSILNWDISENGFSFSGSSAASASVSCTSASVSCTSASIGGSAGAAQDYSNVHITIREGKYHQVKRMFSVLGNEVAYLKRISIGGLVLDPSLSSGECRELSADEINLLTDLTYTEKMKQE